MNIDALQRRIRELELEVESLKSRVLDDDNIKRFMAPLTAIMPSDFKDWHQNEPSEWPVIAASVIKMHEDNENLAWEQAEHDVIN